jgi:hypothetical protein
VELAPNWGQAVRYVRQRPWIEKWVASANLVINAYKKARFALFRFLPGAPFGVFSRSQAIPGNRITPYKFSARTAT